jgi:voltage-gated potassium channel Kch
MPRAGRNLIERRMSRLLREPPSVRTAAGVIVTATALVVVAGGVLMRLLDHDEYSNVWVGMWWALQTVTTVGYGDVTPRNASGRIVATFVMLEGIAFLTIIIAAITSTFVARAAEEHEAAQAAGEDQAEQRIEARLDDLALRLDRLETMLRALTKAGPAGSDTAM